MYKKHILLATLAIVAAACGKPAPDAEEPAHEAAGQAGHAEAPAGHTAHWSYEAGSGPSEWAGLNPDYALCGSGAEQSPIDLSGAVATELKPLAREYQSASVRIIRHEHVVDVVDNGHTIQVNYDDGSVLRIGDKTFELAQYHFHAPSEHTVDGRHSPMEMHLVHQSASGELAVVGVLIDEGEHNAAFDPIWAQLPDEPGEELHLENVNVNVDDMLPEDHRTYRYMGSLTTPPCSEGVNWFVAVEPIQLSADQIGAFTAIINNNNRPVQPLGERALVVDRVAESE